MAHLKPMAGLMGRAHMLGGQGVHPSCWLQLTVRLAGRAVANGAGSQAFGTGSPTRVVVAAHGACVWHGNPQWRKLTGWGDG